LKAVVFAGKAKVAVEDVPQPEIQDPKDAIVEVKLSAICGSDLHVLDGKTPGMRKGGVIGHEFVGRISELGEDVAKHWEDTRVLGSFLIACGGCAACTAKRFNFCDSRRALGLGELQGDLDGAQAEYVRVPNADTNLKTLSGALSGLTDEQAIFGGDILATGFHAAAASDIGADDIVAVVGAGPVGLMCAVAAQRMGADSVLILDTDEGRVRFGAEQLGFDGIVVGDDDVAAAVAGATDGKMATVAMDAVGAVPAFKTAIRTLTPAGGRATVVGVYGAERYELAMGRAWLSGLRIQFTGMANVQAHWDDALFAVAKGELEPQKIVTHRLELEEAPAGYEAFASRKAMKVVLRP
jgi:threonine dehydrogenase-like Zn-dependent dehydrogenase